MIDFNYQTLEAMRDLASAGMYEACRMSTILSEADLTGVTESYLACWFYARESNQVAQNKYLATIQRVNAELRRRSKLVGVL